MHADRDIEAHAIFISACVLAHVFAHDGTAKSSGVCNYILHCRPRDSCGVLYAAPVAAVLVKYNISNSGLLRVAYSARCPQFAYYSLHN